MMPGETGLEVLPKLRAASPETMVVMMSGNATIETAVQATKAGAYDFIEKPLSGDKLLHHRPERAVVRAAAPRERSGCAAARSRLRDDRQGRRDERDLRQGRQDRADRRAAC